MYPLDNVRTNCLKNLNVSSMYPPGKCPLAPSDKDVDRQLNHTKPAMRYVAALGSRLMARILEGDERVRVSRLVTLRQD